ncbi:HupE/UreJ family protein [Jeotgalibacillus marinus]|uniref:HupE/UreJ family protein n=1 Tax=Jeotgalibacillus marinus TaxID=86667 RepID=A0ABV3PZ19_9BACL
MNTRRIFLLLGMMTFFVFLPLTTHAHTNDSEGFSFIEVNEETIHYELKLDLEEFAEAMSREMNESQLFDTDTVQEFLNARIEVYADGVIVEGVIEQAEIETIQERPVAVMNLTYEMKRKPEKIILDYHMFFDETAPSHANFVTIDMDGVKKQIILTYSSRQLEVGEMSFIQNAKQFLSLGVKHIFTGYDHILFILALLFGAKTIRNILSLVTAFTLAHSITLALATFDLVQLPSRIVESAIALSIIYVALIHLLNLDAKHHPWLAFGFGLIHGFGFAGILSEMQLEGSQMAMSLLSFNLGIELGQLFIVSLAFPLILWIKKSTKKPVKWIIPGISVCILVFGLVWFFQRAF